MYRFLLDTGADFFLAPRRLAEEVGLLWETLREARVVGIELGGITASYTKSLWLKSSVHGNGPVESSAPLRPRKQFLDAAQRFLIPLERALRQATLHEIMPHE